MPGRLLLFGILEALLIKGLWAQLLHTQLPIMAAHGYPT